MWPYIRCCKPLLKQPVANQLLQDGKEGGKSELLSSRALGRRARCLRDVLPIDQSITITCSDTGICERREEGEGEEANPSKTECSG